MISITRTSAAGWSPCLGPVYGTILTLAANTGDVGQATPLLTAYSIGLGIPFLICALALDSAQGILHKFRRHMQRIKLFTGAFLVLIGVLVASGQLQRLNQALSAQFTDFSTRVEKCTLGWAEGDIYFDQVGGCLSGQVDADVLIKQNLESLQQ